jgi:hypothetical protein
MEPNNSLPKRVYRYIPIHRLWEILANKKLYFMRNTKWEDPFEGFLLKQYCKNIGLDYLDLISLLSTVFIKPERKFEKALLSIIALFFAAIIHLRKWVSVLPGI